MNLPDYKLDENFLDLVFEHMFEMRGKYGSTKIIHDELEISQKRKLVYNDVVLALEQLEHDGYLFLLKEKWEIFDVYRLTYKGYLEYKSSKSKRPYNDRIKSINNNRIKNISIRIAIIVNAIAILAITGWSVYIDHKDTISSKRLFNIENRLLDLESKIDSSKIDSIKFDFKNIKKAHNN